MTSNVKNASYDLTIKAQVESLARIHLMPMFNNIETDAEFISHITTLLTADISELSDNEE